MPGRVPMTKEDIDAFRQMMKTASEATNILKKSSEIREDPKISKLLEMNEKLDQLLEENKEMKELILKTASIMSKLYADGEINQDTFNKLDEFLKSYYDPENLLEDY